MTAAASVGVEVDSSDLETDFATTASLNVGGGAASDPSGAACRMLLHPNRMAAREHGHGDEGSSSQVHMGLLYKDRSSPKTDSLLANRSYGNPIS